MYRYICGTIIFSMFFCIWFANNYSDASVATKNTLLIIHSYGMDYEWTAGEDAGIESAFEEVLKDKGGWKIERIFLHGKKYQNDHDVLEQIVSRARAEVVRLQPQAAILTDDLAFSRFYSQLHNMGVPLSFCGVNGYIEDYGYKVGDRGITGTLEHNNFPPVIRIIKKLRPTIENIVFVGDVSITTEAIKKNLKGQMSLGHMDIPGINKYDFFETESYELLKKFLLNVDVQRTAVIFISFYTYRDSQGRHVFYRDVDEWLIKNTRIIDGGIASFHVLNGRLLSLASSDREMGYYSAKQLFTAINNNEDPADTPIRKYLPLKLILNHSRARNVGVQFPFELLSYSLDVNKIQRLIQK